MDKKFSAVLDALIPAALVATVTWACLAAADYIALLSIEHLLERWAWLPQGWGDAHERALAVAAALIAVPVIAFVARWMYRSARASQTQAGEIC
jgi:uncharacterized membrane protein YozB (DUF420 family)